MKGLLVLVLAATLFFGCSDDDVNKPVENDSFITGNWVTTYKTAAQGDSLEVNVDLTGKDGSFTGHGKITYAGKTTNSSFRYNWEDDASGTYSQEQITINLVSSFSGNSYKFTGIADHSSTGTKFKGKVTLTINSEVTEINNITLVKSKS